MDHSVYWIHHAYHHYDFLKEGYIGVSVNPKKRFNAHRKYTQNPHLQRALKKYGKDAVLTILWQGPEEECYKLETQYRPQPNIGWNIAPGGDHPGSEMGKKGGLIAGKKIYELKLGIHGFSTEKRQKIGRISGNKTYQMKAGVHGLSTEKRSELGKKNGHKGGLIGGKKSYQMKVGVHGLSTEKKSEIGKKYGGKGGTYSRDHQLGFHNPKFTKQKSLWSAIAGRKHKNSLWVTNGEIDKRIFSGKPIPEGFFPGRTKMKVWHQTKNQQHR